MKALVTGSTGFVGSALLRRVAAEPGWQVRAAVRRPPAVGRRGRLRIRRDRRPGLRGRISPALRTAAKSWSMPRHGFMSCARPRPTPWPPTARAMSTGTLEPCSRSGTLRRPPVHLHQLGQGQWRKQHRRGGRFAKRTRPFPRVPTPISKWEAELGLRELCAADRHGVMSSCAHRWSTAPAFGANFLSLAKRSTSAACPCRWARLHNQRSLVAAGQSRRLPAAVHGASRRPATKASS